MQHTLADDLAAAFAHCVADVSSGQRVPGIALECTLDFDAVPWEIQVRIRVESQVKSRKYEFVDADTGGSQLPVAVENDNAENAAALLPLKEELSGGGAELSGLKFQCVDNLALCVEQLDSQLPVRLCVNLFSQVAIVRDDLETDCLARVEGTAVDVDGGICLFVGYPLCLTNTGQAALLGLAERSVSVHERDDDAVFPSVRQELAGEILGQIGEALLHVEVLEFGQDLVLVVEQSNVCLAYRLAAFCLGHKDSIAPGILLMRGG